MIGLKGLEGFLPGPNITAESFIIQWTPSQEPHSEALCPFNHFPICLPWEIHYFSRKQISVKYQIRLALEDSNILSLDDFTSFCFFSVFLISGLFSCFQVVNHLNWLSVSGAGFQPPSYSREAIQRSRGKPTCTLQGR